MCESFIKMPKEFAERAHDYLNPADALVYLNMLDEFNYYSGKGLPYMPSQAALAKKCFSTQPTVAKAIKSLINKDLVEQQGESKRGSVNLYKVNQWRYVPEVMAGTTNTEERLAYLEERDTGALTNYR
ncbi:hypothetical protein L8O47_10745 [Enterobacter roggenkampii]|uniref:hypothetical protein n=1 Tax=Enterobacter roggenkampii TaxID=1812935 RepID=UPI0020035833|nr:hypothetical protein [Enterobacter roggenkampii]MCK7151385.1 hypothetical protein [Enterobacter roggenkampii]